VLGEGGEHGRMPPRQRGIGRVPGGGGGETSRKWWDLNVDLRTLAERSSVGLGRWRF